MLYIASGPSISFVRFHNISQPVFILGVFASLLAQHKEILEHFDESRVSVNDITDIPNAPLWVANFLEPGALADNLKFFIRTSRHHLLQDEGYELEFDNNAIVTKNGFANLHHLILRFIKKAAAKIESLNPEISAEALFQYVSKNFMEFHPQNLNISTSGKVYPPSVDSERSRKRV